MQPQKIQKYLRIYRDGLLKDNIPFWQERAPDRKRGGFFTFLDRKGAVYGTDKPVWIMGRAAWLFARLYNAVEKRPEWVKLAEGGIDFLEKHCFDSDGRMFFMVTRSGKPLRKRQYLFSETFCAIAFAEYAIASGRAEYAVKAENLFRLILRYHNTPGLLRPKTIPGTRRMKGHSMPMILLATAQVLRRAGDKDIYRATIDDTVFQLERHFLKPEFKALLESVGPRGEFLDEPAGRVINPGHAIETSWFLMEEARFRSDKKLLALALKILDWSLEWGWDHKYGGIFYYRDCRNRPCEQYEHDMKLWWPHNEAIYATLLAHFLTGDTKYATWHTRIHDWAYRRFPDRKYGEWFGYLHRDGTVSSTCKGNAWKGMFHVPRMLLNCWKLLEEAATADKKLSTLNFQR